MNIHVLEKMLFSLTRVVSIFTLSYSANANVRKVFCITQVQAQTKEEGGVSWASLSKQSIYVYTTCHRVVNISSVYILMNWWSPSHALAIEFKGIVCGGSERFPLRFSGPTSRSTTCIAIVPNNHVVVANLGDYHCVISRKGEVTIKIGTILLTCDALVNMC
ncbi:hypothetical protein IFM89_001536 [Coptis chinensis]|uniref:Uncharacterized protein n=1 Tax=Coptis chinensis TaxID=261450 RepID=A0A835HX76_9MAGN|nr:hypothetical protein IFM89_001536 [Coptis chinensis]